MKKKEERTKEENTIMEMEKENFKLKEEICEIK